MPASHSPRVRLSEHVARMIIDLIATQHLQPGDLLPTEPELMGRMEVGRSTVREALHGLAVLGLVEIRQGQGTFVRSATPLAGPTATSVDVISGALSRGLTEELLEAREVIEVRTASMAAQRADPDDLAELKRLVESARASGARSRHGFLLSADFHLGVARAAHNEVLEGFVASYIPLLSERAAVLERLPGYLEWELGEHSAIYLAIAAHDSRAATTRMRSHLRDMVIHYEHVAAAGLRLPEASRHHRAKVQPETEIVNG